VTMMGVHPQNGARRDVATKIIGELAPLVAVPNQRDHPDGRGFHRLFEFGNAPLRSFRETQR